MVILITGITSGFGRAMAERLSADGHKVYGTHRKATDLLSGVTYIKADAQNAADCEALRLETKAFGIQVVVIEPGDFATAFTAQRKSVADPRAYEVYKTYAKSLASIEKDETTGLKPEFLAGKISKIVRKRHPRYHYIISTLEQRLSVTLKKILPPSWFAAILGSYYKL